MDVHVTAKLQVQQNFEELAALRVWTRRVNITKVHTIFLQLIINYLENASSSFTVLAKLRPAVSGKRRTQSPPTTPNKPKTAIGTLSSISD